MILLPNPRPLWSGNNMSESTKEFSITEQINPEILQGFQELTERSGQKHVVFLVDIEGVIYPFKFSQDRSTGKLSFIDSATITVESSRDSNGKARKLPANKHLIDIISAICDKNPQSMVASASQLNLGRPEIIAKIDPIYHSAMDGAEASLRGMVKRDGSRLKSLTPTSDSEKIPDSSLLVIINDRTEEDGTPPKTIIDNLRRQTSSGTFKYIQVQPPPFVFDISDKTTFNIQTDRSFIEGFKKEPVELPLPKTKVTFTADKLIQRSRPIIRRPGD
jgi:hypothetical protein